jgi:hypothetical protein
MTAEHALEELLSELKRRAWKKKGDWAYELVEEGYLVAVRVREDMRRELRTATKEPRPEFPAWSSRLMHAARNRARANGGWALTDQTPDQGEPTAYIWTEVYEYEVRPGIGQCTGCGEEVGYSDFTKRPQCSSCR